LLIVGLDSDGSIRLSKGAGRPVFTQKVRLEVISELSSVDYVFGIRRILDFTDKEADVYYRDITKRLSPDFIITHSQKDRFISAKNIRARELGIRPLVYRSASDLSSTEVVEEIMRLG